MFDGSHAVGKAGEESAKFIIAACEFIQRHADAEGGGGGASIAWAGTMTDGASNMMQTQARALRAKFGPTFLVANCAMHVMSLVMSVAYLCAFPPQQKEVPTPLALMKNLSYLFHDAMEKSVVRALALSARRGETGPRQG